jgi:hypothetical protein
VSDTSLTGGLRDRLVDDAVHLMLRDALTALGWLAPAAHRREVTLIAAPVQADVEIVPTTVSVVREDLAYDLIELGSQLSEDRSIHYVDIYGENDAVAKHLAGDLRDILRGKMPAIGRTAPVVAVFDRTQTPVPAEPAFHVEIEDVVMERAREVSRAWERYWWMIRFDVVDER